MYEIKDKKLREEMETVLEVQGIADVEYDDMQLRYVKEEESIKTILRGFVNYASFISYYKGNHYNRSIITLVIPEGIDVIGSLFWGKKRNDLYMTNIEGRLIDRVVLPDSCKEIWDYAFYGCYNLESVEWKNVNRIGYRALLHTLISQNDIPFHIQTESQVCCNNDEARKPTDDKDYVEYRINGKWIRKSVKEVLMKDESDKTMRIRFSMRLI